MPSAQLEYAAVPRRRFRVRLRWLALVLLLAAIFVAWRYGWRIRDQASLRWTVRQCLNYSRGEDSVAYEANRYYANDLAARDSTYRVSFPPSLADSWQFRGAFKPVDAWDTLALRNLPALTSNSTPNIRSTLFTLPGGALSYVGPGGKAPTHIPYVNRFVAPFTFVAPIFVHERKAIGHPARLIVVELTNSLQHDQIECFVIDPGPHWGKPTLIRHGKPHEVGETIPGVLSRAGLPVNANEPAARVYFGQIDPNDSARFTFRVAVLQAQFNFDGRVLADDTIEIDGPLLSEVLMKTHISTGEKSRR
jgi:hypothetical protein